MTRPKGTGTMAASFGLMIAIGPTGCRRLNMASDPDTLFEKCISE